MRSNGQRPRQFVQRELRLVLHELSVVRKFADILRDHVTVLSSCESTVTGSILAV